MIDRSAGRLHRRAAAVPQLGAIWQTKIRTEMLLQRLATDPHSPAEFRCNQIVRNIAEFYAAFGVTENDATVAGRGSAGQDLVIFDWQPVPLRSLADRIEQLAGPVRPAVIGLNGHSSSGKTTLGRAAGGGAALGAPCCIPTTSPGTTESSAGTGS